ncbi:MAG: glycosyltransferase family 4 protein [Chloroflexota bacterium]
MRVLIASKILVVSAYRDKLRRIAEHPSVERLVVITPPSWNEPGGRTLTFESATSTEPYDLRVAPIAFNGRYHFFFWPGLGHIMREIRPDVVHLDEEPYNVATAHGAWLAARTGAATVFFTWQNLLRRYPLPFRMIERYVYRQTGHALAGSQDALGVLRAKGYRGAGSIVPQFGVDPELFAPAATVPAGPPRIGFIARLVEEKGVLVLIEALAGLAGDWQLHVIGSGPLEADAQRRVAELGFSHRVTWERGVVSTDIPDRLRSFTVLVQPSVTRPHWKEQFGRAVMEAMACGIPVVACDSGEIPHVLGDAGLLVAEDRSDALRGALAHVLADAELRRELGRRGRARVLAHYTNDRIAEDTVRAYADAHGRRVTAGPS